MKWVSLVLTMLLSMVPACTARNAGSITDARTVLATTTVLADITRSIAGDQLVVNSLLPAGADPHGFEPTPTDLVRISDSAVLITNGAGYERFLTRVLESARGDRPVIEASKGLEALRSGDEIDPHLWVDPNNVIEYVHNIERGLSQAFPDSADLFASNAASYSEQLRDLDAWIVAAVAKIPPERRLLVTNHQALQHFAHRYGFRIMATVLASPSSDAAGSARHVSDVVEQIRIFQVPAIFLDTVENDRLAAQIAKETGVTVVHDLHIESLTDGPPAQTYLDMMRHNITRIVEALDS